MVGQSRFGGAGVGSFQISDFRFQISDFGFGIWDLFGHWCLVIGHSLFQAVSTANFQPPSRVLTRMSDQYLLPCACGAKTRVGRAQAGQEVACASCGKPLTVPTLRGLRDLESAPPETSGGSQRGNWSPLRGAIFSGGLLLALLAFLFAGYQLWSYAAVSTMTTDYSDEVTELEEAQIDEMNPADMYDMWHAIEEHGIGPKQVPIWVAAQDAAKSYSRQAMIATVVGVAGALASLGAVFFGRQR